MPATSEKQKRFMDAAAHNPAFAKKAGVPVSVAKDFSEKSKGIKFGGNKSRPDLQKVNEPKTRQGKTELFNKGGDTMASKMNAGFMAMMAKKKGAGDSPMGKPVMKKGMDMAKDGMKKMAGGGAMPMKDGKPAFIGDGKGTMAKGGMAKADMKQDKGMMQKAVNKHEGRLHKGAAMTKLAKGGGIESKGKTKGTMIKMKNGGKAC